MEDTGIREPAPFPTELQAVHPVPTLFGLPLRPEQSP